MTASPDPAKDAARRRRVLVAMSGLSLLVVAALAAVYEISAGQRNPLADPVCRGAVALARKVAPLMRGEVAALAAASEPRRVPNLAFRDASGAARTLADWQGRSVLLNLWATWCAPCRKEMPALDRLESALGGPRFDVVAINIDTRNPDRPRAFLDEAGVSRLGYYTDPSGKVFQDLKTAGWAIGMPTTLVVDPQGCEVAALSGPAEWSSEDAVKLVSAVIAP